MYRGHQRRQILTLGVWIEEMSMKMRERTSELHLLHCLSESTYRWAVFIVDIPRSTFESFHHMLRSHASFAESLTGLFLDGFRRCLGVADRKEILGDLGVYASRGDVDGLAKAITGLLEEPERGRALGQRLRERVIEHFSWQSTARQLVKAYDIALAQK